MTPGEKARLDAAAAHGGPLVVCDIDEVVLEFVAPFMRFLDSRGHELRVNSFRLTGNIYMRTSGEAADRESVSAFLEDFFAEHDVWQEPVTGARESLAALETGYDASVVFLTAMPPRHHSRRRSLLDSHGFHHPMIATEGAKGEALAELLHAFPDRRVAFIDDLPNNHLSILETAPDALTLHLMAFEPLRPHLPPMPKGVVSARDWPDAERRIGDFFRRPLPL